MFFLLILGSYKFKDFKILYYPSSWLLSYFYKCNQLYSLNIHEAVILTPANN